MFVKRPRERLVIDDWREMMVATVFITTAIQFPFQADQFLILFDVCPWTVVTRLNIDLLQSVIWKKKRKSDEFTLAMALAGKRKTLQRTKENEMKLFSLSLFFFFYCYYLFSIRCLSYLDSINEFMQKYTRSLIKFFFLVDPFFPPFFLFFSSFSHLLNLLFDGTVNFLSASPHSSIFLIYNNISTIKWSSYRLGDFLTSFNTFVHVEI